MNIVQTKIKIKKYESPKIVSIPLEKIKLKETSNIVMYGACREIDRICGHGETGCATDSNPT